MPWLLIWIVLAVVAVVVIGLAVRHLWRSGRALAQDLGRAATTLEQAAARLEASVPPEQRQR